MMSCQRLLFIELQGSSIQLLFVVEICLVTIKQASATEKKYVIKDIFAKDC